MIDYSSSHAQNRCVSVPSSVWACSNYHHLVGASLPQDLGVTHSEQHADLSLLVALDNAQRVSDAAEASVCRCSGSRPACTGASPDGAGHKQLRMVVLHSTTRSCAPRPSPPWLLGTQLVSGKR